MAYVFLGESLQDSGQEIVISHEITHNVIQNIPCSLPQIYYKSTFAMVAFTHKVEQSDILDYQ